MKLNIALLATAAVVALLTGCETTPQSPKSVGYLSSYTHLEKVDPTTERYVNKSRLGSYNKFIVAFPKVTVTEYNGKPVTNEQREKAATYLQNAIIKALGDRYPVVKDPSADTAEIRIAVTDAFKAGGRLGLSIEGEIQDTYSAVQIAAVVKSEVSDPSVGEWWNSVSFRELSDKWALRLREVIDSSRHH